MPRAPRPPSQPAAEPADPGSESESDQIGVEVAEEIARWSAEEMVILDKYLPKFKEKDKAGRKRLLVWKVLVQMKALYKGKDWSQRKQQIKYWYNNRGRREVPMPRFKQPRAVTMNQVISRKYKAEINLIAAEMSNGARSGSRTHFGKYVKALGVFKSKMSKADLDEAEKERKVWQEQGLPENVKRTNAMKHTRNVMKGTAETEFKELGVRKLTWEYHEDLEGGKLFHCHDFNPDIGGIVGLKPFAVLYPDVFVAFENAFWAYIKHIGELEKGKSESGSEVRKNRNAQPAIELLRDTNGFPLIPAQKVGDGVTEGLVYQKQLVRTFVKMHYQLACGREFTRVPWKQIADRNSVFIDPMHLAKDVKLMDPSSMSKASISKLLDWWRVRQMHESGLHTFRFRQCCSKGSLEDTEVARYDFRFEDALDGSAMAAGYGNLTSVIPEQAGGLGDSHVVAAGYANPAFDWDMQYEAQRVHGEYGMQLADSGADGADEIAALGRPNMDPASVGCGLGLPGPSDQSSYIPTTALANNLDETLWAGPTETWLQPELLDKFLEQTANQYNPIGFEGTNLFAFPPPGPSGIPIRTQAVHPPLASEITQPHTGDYNGQKQVILPSAPSKKKSSKPAPKKKPAVQPRKPSKPSPLTMLTQPVVTPAAAPSAPAKSGRGMEMDGNENQNASAGSSRARVPKRQFEFAPGDGPKPSRKKAKKKN